MHSCWTEEEGRDREIGIKSCMDVDVRRGECRDGERDGQRRRERQTDRVGRDGEGFKIDEWAIK